MVRAVVDRAIRIVYAGTPEFAVPALERLLDESYDIVGVYTQPDRPAGRGRQVHQSPVKQIALEQGIAVHQPVSFKEDEVASLKSLNPDLLVVAAYGIILSKEVLDIPRLGCINIHASLLPRWRGAAPIQRAIIEGDRETGITIMQMDEGLDTGKMLLKKTCQIGDTETGSSLHDRLKDLGGEALVEALPGIISGNIEGVDQDERLVTYASKLTKQEAAIDWGISAVEIERRVRAYNAWPVAYTKWSKDESDPVNLRIWEAEVCHLEDDIDHTPGEVIRCSSDGIDVYTADGALRIKTLQLPGKKVLAASEFLNAHQLTGQIFGAA